MRRLLAGIAIFTVVLFGGAAANAAGTAAGTDITNKATVTYTVGAATMTANSNTTTLKVAELLNVSVTWQDAGSIQVSPGATNQAATFRVTNTGNGTETFPLSLNAAIPGDNFDPVFVKMYFDSNNNGVYDAGTDSAYAAGTNDPTLAADAKVTVFVLDDIPAGLADAAAGKVGLTATAKTGSGAAGTVIAGAGDGGTDAVVGTSGATQTAQATYVVANITVTVAKAQAVQNDPVFGTKPVPGATIRYTITVTVTGTGTAVGVVITDPIPANTTYTAGTLTLNGATLSDAKDGDKGDVGGTTAGTATVAVGDLTSASLAQTITFDVKIN
ncbi:MAG: DUF11 domain-containing protein [Deltaproteobacteria bacterium]|nr:DUF11 domain-containing protein [Deltaproteobacteria bacterium]